MTPHDRQKILNALARGRPDEAEAACQAFLQGEDGTEALYMMAVIRGARGDFDTAARLFEDLSVLLPGRADVAFDFGVTLQRAGRLAEAAEQWRRATAIEPRFADAWRNLALAQSDLGALDGAFAAFKRLLELRPQESAAILSDMGNLRFRQADVAAAAELYSRATASDPRSAIAWTNLGMARKAQGRVDEAEACMRRAVAEDGSFAKGHFNLGCLRLGSGHWREGFAGYEWRASRLKVPPLLAALPSWSPDSPEGGHVALWNDQGFGDAIQFVRFAPRLAARGCRVSLVLGPPLRRLLATAPGLDGVHPLEGPLPPFDTQLPLASLPHRLGIDDIDEVWSGPYLKAGASSAFPAYGNNPAIGLVWAGTTVDPARSLPMDAALAPLFAIAGIDWVSLQLGAPAGALAISPWRGRVVDATAGLSDFAATAALVSRLDLVLSIDTAVAHVAGALGKDAWVLLRKDADWRWLHEGGRTPWYPTLRLFRQPREGDWETLIQDVAGELARLALGRPATE